jgi:fatty acid desaturase/predicted heme/steroid binding protein
MGKGAGSGGEKKNSGGVMSNARVDTKQTEGRRLTLAEVAKHRTPEDCWMHLKGKVYDVSNWNDHPGGSVLFTHGGDDFTDIFAAFHPASAHKDLQRFYIGELDESVVPKRPNHNGWDQKRQKEFEKAYRTLLAKMITAGLFKPNKLYFLYKVLSTLSIAAVAVYCATQFNDSWPMTLLGAVILGLFWQQCGWLAHDFLHHQVFQTRMYGDIAGHFIGNVLQGFSVAWWKNKHNKHHAVPNLLQSVEGANDGDPDVDTAPIIFWSLKMAESAKDSAFGRFMVSWQAVFYFPVLFFARLAWAQQSFSSVFGIFSIHENVGINKAPVDKAKMQYPTLEKLGLAVHYLTLLYIMSHMQLAQGLAFFMVAQTSCGLFLALVFGLGHNGMAVYQADERPDFWKLQVSTTRNITSTWFVDFFCGGLQYQVDHHLFPSLPRHNLRQANELMTSFCKAQGVTYHETDMVEGTKEVLAHLSEVAREFLTEFPAM